MYKAQPKHEAGEILDLRFTRDSMPDRIYIDMVYRKPKSTEWMYRVRSEKNGGVLPLYISEKEISQRISRKNKKCYEHDMVKQLYDSGFRFCGNSKFETAFARAQNMKCANYIRHIILAEAVDPDGNMLDGQLGIWVQYNAIFEKDMDDTPQKNEDGYYHIK